MANHRVQRKGEGNGSRTVGQYRTAGLEAKLRGADSVVAGAGGRGMITGEMLSEDTVVIDVGINRIETDEGSELVGDVDFESAKANASAITPVPGGVGPMTRAMLLYNTVKAASRQADVRVALD